MTDVATIRFGKPEAWELVLTGWGPDRVTVDATMQHTSTPPRYDIELRYGGSLVLRLADATKLACDAAKLAQLVDAANDAGALLARAEKAEVQRDELLTQLHRRSAP
jgi:hypothetical protein